MKKLKMYILVILMFFLNSLYVEAAEVVVGYDEAINMVQEVMKQYYIRGPYIQYNFSKAEYYGLNPEEATSQDNRYTVCAGFTHNVYNQAFGIKGETKFMSGNNEFRTNVFPQYNYHIIYAAQSAYQKIKNKDIDDDGTQLLYYESNVNTTDNGGDGFERTREKVRYLYGDKNLSTTEGDFETLVKNVKPGDLFVFSGHALIAYDAVDTNNDGIIDDVLLLNAAAQEDKNKIYSKITGNTSSLYYNIFKTSRKGTDILNLEAEGGIQLILLSSQGRFVRNGILNCLDATANAVDECAVIRPFYKGKNNNAIFNFSQMMNEESVKKSLLRTKYPGLFIEKKVDKGDNNNVNIGDKLTYTIKITNKSYVAVGNGRIYEKFIVEEILDNNVECVDCIAKGWQVDGSKIKKVIETLPSKETKELTYTVKIKDDINLIGTTIKSVGSFYDKDTNKELIITGIVENKVVPKVESATINTYSSCYLQKKESYVGLELIDQIYNCARGENFNFKNFNFASLFSKQFGNKNTSTIKFQTNLDSDHIKFKNMILNNYFNGLPTNDITYYLPRWSSKSAVRARTINSTDFKDGDVLIYNIKNDDIYTCEGDVCSIKEDIYTFENGIYAYIYIDGWFVGVNGEGKTTRNIFSQSYHSASYWQENKYFKETIGNNTFKYQLTIEGSLYAGNWKDTTSFEKKFINYQTLYGKDNYVILRPELIIKEPFKVEIVSKPTKLNYIQNSEKLDVSGGFVKVTYNDATTEIINMSNKKIKISGFDNSKLGTNTITVTHEGKTTTYRVTIIKKETLQAKFLQKGYKIKNSFVHGFKLEELLTNIKNKVELNYTSTGGNKVIATGVEFKYNEEKFTAVVYGDLNGDGKINSADLLKMRQHLLGTNTLIGAYKEAGSIATGTTINSADLLRIRQHLLGQKLIEQ